MFVVKRVGGLIKKKKSPGLRKKKRSSQLTVSLLVQQELTSLPARILKKLDKIIAMGNQAIQPLIP